MQWTSQRTLSANERKLRIDTVAVALRKFQLVDDGTISTMFLGAEPPGQVALAKAIARLDGLPRSFNPSQIASFLLAEVAESDSCRSLLLPPTLETPSLAVKSQAELTEVAGRIIYQLKHAVEQQVLWRQLWNGARPCKEERCQALFQLAATSWCEAYNIDLSAEVDIGRGPVDFKMSCGWQSRALIEVKLASNSRFWRGLSRQLPQYMLSERIAHGYFVAFIFDGSDERRIAAIKDVATQVSNATRYDLDVVSIDARRENKKSASKL